MAETGTKENRVEELQQEWEEKQLEPALKKMPESQPEFTTVSLKPIKRLYTPADLAGIKLRMPPGEAWQFLGRALGAVAARVEHGKRVAEAHCAWSRMWPSFQSSIESRRRPWSARRSTWRPTA